MLSAVMEDYLKAIYHLQQETDEEVSTSEIADHLDVTAPTVSNMLDKLEDQELINREKYKGVSLTPDGEQVALEVIRHHRLLKTYLTEHLDYSWADVHDEADRLEHHISDALAARVAATLNDPERDPTVLRSLIRRLNSRTSTLEAHFRSLRKGRWLLLNR